MNNMKKILVAAMLLVIGSSALADGHGEVMGLEDSEYKSKAVAWINATYTSHAAFKAMVKKNMAKDGVFMPRRYVGFGFQLDPNNDEQMVVAWVTPDTPAAEVLMEGDVFASVAGVPATRKNRDRMNFRGKPGQPVKAVIVRDGKKMPIEVKRGVIATPTSKSQSLANLEIADVENWPVDSFEIGEVIGEGNVVYVVSSYVNTEADTGIEFTERTLTRFVFNENGKVAWIGSLGESRFVLEQQGYTISR
jgi:hypothetical protein